MAPKPQEGEVQSRGQQVAIAPHHKSESWLRHPVILLLLGSVLSAIFVPWISARMNDGRLLNEARLQQCRSLLSNGTDSDRRLNTLLTTMEMFIKDTASEKMLTDEERHSTRAELARQYREFDGHVWWWISRLPTEVKLLRIEVDPNILASITVQYQKNIITSTEVLDRLWELCVRKSVKPGDTKLNVVAAQTRRDLTDLQAQRQTLIGQLVYLFAPQEPKI